jgi:hypothetical protein
LSQGCSWTNRVAVEQTVAQTVSGGDIETKQSFSTTWRFAVLGRDADGGLSMEAVFERLQIKMRSPMGNWNFDSAGIDDPGSPLAALRGLSGGRFTFTIGPDMRVREVGGLAELSAQMAAAAKDPELASIAGSYINEASIRASLETMFGLFPDKNIAVGESWTRTSTPGGGMPVVVRGKITATKIAGDRLSARVEGRIEPAGESGTVELRGRQSGIVELDARRLRILGGSISQDLAGRVQVGGTMVPMTVKSSTRFELADQEP